MQVQAVRRITVLAVHGNGGGAFRFDLMAPYLRDHFELRALTLPGFDGQSLDGTRTLADFASVICRAVDACSRPRVLLGSGIGGTLVLQALQQDRCDVDGVVLHAPVGAYLDRRWLPRLMRSRQVRQLAQRMIAARWLRPLWRRLFFKEARQIPRPYRDRFFAAYGACAAFGLMFDLITAEWFNTLEPVSIPAGLIWGANERLLSPQHVREFERLLPGARIRVVDGWGHFPMIEQPQAFAQVAMELIEENLN